ncbi:putative ubiquitin-conjugating enzyme E2 38 isoform X2 [Oryza brachyantha]|nr:putative ubiquitin-conjugating enzyme E2 38 isoform X2 [Oryza brachyantha]XP_015688167.1 putative ubiquitin-conjugating enzyme E2 38 isoform X2 [Oryza brachyantha]
MVLNRVLKLFCVKNKDSKKKGKAINPLCKVAAPHPTENVCTNNNLLDPLSSGTGTVLSVQKHDPECSSVISSMTRTEYGSESDGYNSFNQFDVVQDFSDHYYAKNSPGKTTKEWAKTIQNEWKLLQKDLPESVYVRVYEDRIDLLRAAIVGPAGTPYHDGLFFFDVRFPSEYPQCPPKVHYHSGGLRLNPNLYESGKVCLSLLNTWWGTGCEKWGKSKSTILQVLVSIQGLVLNDKPYFNEPGNKNSANTAPGEKNSLAYNQTTFLLSCRTMMYSLRKPPKYCYLFMRLNSFSHTIRPLQHFESLVARHFHDRERAILDACGSYMSGTVVGSSPGNGTKYPRDNRSFADFKKSLEKYTELLRKDLATNRTQFLELTRDSSSAAAADEIVVYQQLESFCQSMTIAGSPV